MRNAHSVEQVRAAEKVLLDALPEGTLMGRAATGLAHAVIDFLGGAYGRRVLLLVGSGDNGGDALYAGARLARRGASVDAVLLSERVHPAGLAALREAGGKVVSGFETVAAQPPQPPGSAQPPQPPGSAQPPQPPGSARPPRPADGWDVVIDGIVGIGGRPGLRAEVADLLSDLEGVPVVAVDVPSGVDVDTGRLDGDHVTADLTVTFGTHKVAHLVDPAAASCGVVALVDIGLELPTAAVTALQPDDVAVLLPMPDLFDHKYTRGVVGVRAGSATYPGAGVLCVAGASCGLAGMVRYVGEAAVADLVRQAHPEVIAGAGRVQAWVVGSGGGPKAGDSLREALADGVPVVVDADALSYVSRPLPVEAVLTPHAGELARMLHVTREQVEEDQLHHAREAAARFGAVVVLKGRHSLVASPSGDVRVTTTGLPWLATAGAGDVLAGLIGALLAAGLDAFDAASAGSWLHGAAATLASAGGPIGADDVAAAIPVAVTGLVGR